MKILLILFIIYSTAASAQEIVVSSKTFTESYVLGEVIKRAAEERGLEVTHKQGIGGTIILWQALTSGGISAYPEYTGTIAEEILKDPTATTIEAIRGKLAPFGMTITNPLGFNNTYALAMRRATAESHGITSISDLAKHTDLVVGVTHEFLGRADGWKPLAKAYGLEALEVRGISHSLGYSALASGDIDVIDAYSTDAKIAEHDLAILKDDRAFFPRYDAVVLYSMKADPRFIEVLQSLEGRIAEATMIKLNAEAERSADYTKAASLLFASSAPQESDGLVERTFHRVARHLQLVFMSLFFAVIIGIPLGILAFKSKSFGAIILAATGIVQTIPSLALLALLVAIPFFGISTATAVIALFLYSLLPIVRSTASGLESISLSLRESAEALGLPPAVRMRKIYLPLASRSILSGVKTSAVINVGTATLAALIGAGGLGEPIISGLNLNDTATILEGAVPAAGLALVVEALFLVADRIFIPKGLRI